MTSKTPLYEKHIALDGRMVDFAGWLMPVQYKGLQEEHQSTRNHVGLFDVSHMGEIRVKGPKALEFLESVTTNLVGQLEPLRAQYNLLPNDKGGLVDDIYIYCLEKNTDYLICVNASNDEKDWQWLLSHKIDGAELTHESSKWAQVAVQGPGALKLISEVLDHDVTLFKKNQILRGSFNGGEFIFATTGYTGEMGGEIFISSPQAESLWDKLLQLGSAYHIAPSGLGARDTLRTEMGYPLYGHEISDTLNPFAANLGWVIKSDQKNFLGKSEILAGKAQGLTHKLVGIELIDKGIARAEHRVKKNSDNNLTDIGWVTSGTFSPTLQKGIALAYVALPEAFIGNQILIEVRSKLFRAKVVSLPFVKK